MPPPPPEQHARSLDKGHGRREKRTLRTTTILTKFSEWSGLKQGFEITRERTLQGKTTIEVEYGITSLSPERANAERLLALTRSHWGIENGLHYRRDVTMGEDASQISKGGAPQIMAALRNTVIHVLTTNVSPNLAAAMRTMNNCLSKALNLLGLPQLE